MKHIIAGTAGHIDHGKTSLVRALTNIDTDRLAEEKRRGITIDIGFAHLDLTADLRIGFVDVPGHERFVKNMLAGASGIDLVLLVVAADESIKPQTREHFHICRLLGIRNGMVVLTKSDLVDRDLLDLVRLEVEELVSGSFLEGAPVVPVSSATGSGLDQLKQELCKLARAIQEKSAIRHFRLPVDRSFIIRGFGTVVTGTLISGSVSKDQELEIHPGGRRCRVRGIQVHGEQAQRAFAGQRTALNLSDVDAAEIERGMMLTLPGCFEPVRHLDCQVSLLDSVPPLKHRAPVHFHWGAAEIEAEVRLFGQGELQPGNSAFARIVLHEPAQVLPGDRFIIRKFSPVITIGGGTVVDITGRRYRASDAVQERLQRLTLSVEERIAAMAAESGGGIGVAEVIARTGLLPSEIEEAVRSKRFVVLRQPELWILDAEWFRKAAEQIIRTVADFHKQKPLATGMPKQELRGRELADAPAFVLEALLQSPRLAVEGDIVRLSSHRLVLKEDEERARGIIESAFADAGLAVPSVMEVIGKSGIEAARAKSVLQILVREKRLARVSEDLVFHVSAIETLKQTLAQKKGQRFGVPEFKEWTGISRKYAIPLLEFLDRERLTRRDGDARVIL